jgi:hypothetical protein
MGPQLLECGRAPLCEFIFCRFKLGYERNPFGIARLII